MKKRLTIENRILIENLLRLNYKLKDISNILECESSTVSREIKKRRITGKGIYKECEKIKRFPYVCNGCKSRSGCRKIRWTYYARESQKSYEELIKSCRQGVNLTLEEIHTINETITPLVKKGQTTNHLYINHPDILDFSKSSFYRYIKNF